MRILTGAIAASLLATLVGCGGASQASPSSTSASPTAAEPESSPSLSDEEVTEKMRESVAGKTYNYVVSVKTVRKQCFGSAGCNVTVRLKVSYVVDPKSAFSLTVRVFGDESGTITETIDVDEDGQFDVPEIDLSTPRSATKVKAKVASVDVY